MDNYPYELNGLLYSFLIWLQEIYFTNSQLI